MLRYLQLKYESLRSVASGGGSTKGALTCGFLRTYVVPVPPQNEQTGITAIADALSTKLKVEEARGSAFAALFDSLLADLMKGRRRIVLPEVA